LTRTEHLLGHALGLVDLEGLLGLLDQSEYVAHAEDPRRHPLRVEDVEVLELLARGGEQDRSTGELRDGQRRTTTRVTVELGEDGAPEADPVAERRRSGDR